MVISESTMERIRRIVNKHYNRLIVQVLGRDLLNAQQLRQLREAGYDTSNNDSLLSMIYYHNFINNPRDTTAPTSVGDMKAQQNVGGMKPQGEANDFSVENLNRTTKQQIEKLKLDVGTRIENLLRQNNNNYKFNALQNLDRSEIADQLVKESSLGRVKQQLRDSAKDANRDWQRVALTEMSDAIGAGSVDRIVTDNREKEMDDVYVYRVIVGDSVTCKYCRRFYGDVGEPPKIYRLSTLLANGSNYGRKAESWQPVVGATHPNTRTSQIIELKPGFQLLPGGQVTFIGMDKWPDYITENLVA